MLNEDDILKKFLEITRPVLTSSSEDFSVDMRYYRLVLGYHPKLICLVGVGDWEDSPIDEGMVANSFKREIEAKFQQAEDLEKLSQRRLIKFIRWLFHY